MKTLGDQVREFRKRKGWKTAELAARVGTSRQNIESLEAKGNRIPKYLGALAAVMGTTADDMLRAADLAPRQPAPSVAAAIKAEAQQDPYELIERGLRALVIVGDDFNKVMGLVREMAAKSEVIQAAVLARLKETGKNGA